MPDDIRLAAFLVCDSVSKDTTTGKATVIGVFDRIFARSVPAVHSRMTAYFRFYVGTEQTKIDVRLAFVSPAGLREETPSLPLNMGQSRAVEGSINIQGFSIQSFGEYEFHLIVNGKQVATYPITVDKITEETSGAIH